MDREAIYLRLPVALQNAMASLEGWRVQHVRYSSSFVYYLQLAENRLSWSDEQIVGYLNDRLRNFVRHCVQTVPYYRRLFVDHGIDMNSISSLNDMQKIPLLTKSTVQDHYQELLSEAVPQKQRIITHTSGTTGGGLRFATTLDAIHEQWATWWRYRRIHGIQLDTWCGHFGGRSVVSLSQKSPPFWRYNLPGHQILFSAYHMAPDTIRFYVDELRRRKLPWLHGYPSLLALVGGCMLEQDLELGYVPRWITTGAENLLPQQATVIERAFGVRPIQHYGMAEAIANFSQCRHGRLHVDEDFAAVEFILNPDGPGYKVIGTNFTELATPLLRYDIGDIIELGDGSCDCGLPGRIVKRVDGRQEDYVILRNGARLGRMDHVFKDMVSIREAQLYQNTPGVIEVRVVRNNSYSNRDENRLLQELYKRIGDEAEVHVVYVERIERSATGKLRFVVSNIDEGYLVSR